MASVKIDGSPGDLDRVSDAVLAGAAAVEVLSPFERRLCWDVLDRSGSTSSTVLRSGITLSASTIKWERSWTMAVDHAASPLKFVLTRGPGPRLTTSDGDDHALGGGVFHISQIHRPVRLQFEFDDRASEAHHEQLALEIDRGRLHELLGTTTLPAAIEGVLSSPRVYPSVAQPMVPALYRLLDEILHCDRRGASRRLHLEAKGLELLAALIDQVEAGSLGASPHVSQRDRERLEQARQILLARMSDPPGLHELARASGLNEAKLKAGFRALFGASVYAYLRDFRMDAARRLLRERRYSVTEVAAQVGYANPSKFAAVFRKRFGISPSEVG